MNMTVPSAGGSSKASLDIGSCRASVRLVGNWEVNFWLARHLRIVQTNRSSGRYERVNWKPPGLALVQGDEPLFDESLQGRLSGFDLSHVAKQG